MSKLMLYIPTYRRVDRQITLRCLSKNWRERTILVCPKDELKALTKQYPDVYRIQTPPVEKVPNIAAKRAWILQTTPYEKILMFDDDLTITVRGRGLPQYAGYQNGDPKKWHWLAKTQKALTNLSLPSSQQQDDLFSKIEGMLTLFAHGGISARFMNQSRGHEWINNYKATHALAYNVPIVLNNCKLGRVRMFEDLDYTLQLLRQGYENAIYCWAAVNAHGFNAPGGESENRKPHDISYGADLMAKLHPGIVRVVERQGPDAEKFGPKRIVVGWQKAIREGRGK